MAKKVNTSCPPQAERERVSKHEGHELDCDYYEVNSYGEDRSIPDQDEIRRERERKADEDWYAQRMAQTRDDDDAPETAVVPRTETKIVRTLDVIATEIRAFTASMLGNIIEIGRRMVEAKELLPHGEFGPWIKVNTGYSTSTANNYMRLFLEYGSPQGSLFGAEVNCQTFGNLNYSQALALLDVPAEEREAFVQEHHVEDMSARELKQAIRERDEAKGKLTHMEADLEDLRDDLQRAKSKASDAEREAKEYSRAVKRLEKELAELKAKPVEVAVEVDQTAIDKAVEEASAELQTRLDAVKEDKAAEIDKLTRHLQTALADKEKADKALEAANHDPTEARAKLEEARKPKDTAQQDKERAEFEFYFNQAQDTANKLRGMLLKARGRGDTETAERLKKAMTALGEAIKGGRVMSGWYDQAAKRLKDEEKAVTGTRERAMSKAVKATLLDFCRQDEEFAQAVAQGGRFKDCMAAVAKGVVNSISDLDAYKKAVSFYFPGAGIRVKMEIDLCDSVKDAPHIDGPGIVLNLEDFFK